jgi:hypothetical protein
MPRAANRSPRTTQSASRGSLRQCFVLALPRLEPGPIVVLGQVDEELDGFGSEAGERRCGNSHGRILLGGELSDCTAARLSAGCAALKRATELAEVDRSSGLKSASFEDP